MDKCQKFFEALSDGSFENMTGNERERFDHQLEQNPDCVEKFERMKKTLSLVKENNVPDPGQEYWDSFYETVESGLDKSSNQKKYWPILFRAAAFIIGGIFIGYLLFDNPAKTIVNNSAANPDIKQAALVQETADMLEDSKVLLLGIANFSGLENSEEKIDFGFQKEQSNFLLLQTADLKKQLPKSKNRRVLRLLNDLELILLQIANIEDEFDLPAIEMIRDGANSQALIFKINMERMLMEAGKEKAVNKSIKNKTQEI